MRSLELVQVGCGDIFSRRYVNAVGHLQRERPEIDIRWVSFIDIIDDSVMRPALNSLGLDEGLYTQVKSSSVESIKTVVDRLNCTNPCVLIASPPVTHVPLALALLQDSRLVALEKPFSSERGHIDMFLTALKVGLGGDLFCFNYYYQEKALPLFFLKNGSAPKPVLESLNFPLLDWREVLSVLGQVRRIQGIILEGEDTREWTFQRQGGGQTLETFSHLLAISLPFLDNPILKKVLLARSSLSPFKGAETTVYCDLIDSGGVEVSLGMSKWTHHATLQKWMVLEFDGGIVLMDLELEVMTVHTRQTKSRVAVSSSAKYVPQFRQLFQRFVDGNVFDTLTYSLQASILGIDVRNVGISELRDFSGDPTELPEFSRLLKRSNMFF